MRNTGISSIESAEERALERARSIRRPAIVKRTRRPKRKGQAERAREWSHCQ